MTDTGFAIHDGVFRRDDLDGAVAALARADVPRTKAGARHVLAVPAVRALANDPRLIEIATQSVGPAATPFRATLFDKSPAANWLVTWHQDTVAIRTAQCRSSGSRLASWFAIARVPAIECGSKEPSCSSVIWRSHSRRSAPPPR